jgi:integral membrane protein (TIGR01906 family)
MVKRIKFSDFLIGIIFTLLFVSVSVIITVNFRPLYYLDVKLLDIEQSSGYPKEEILDNYNALIDYNSPFYRGSLKFPTLEASEAGLQHFKEVKDIFIVFYILAVLTLTAAAAIIVYKYKKRDISYLRVSSLTAILLPSLLGVLIMLNFDRAFVIFHKLFFNNDYWLFDPATDPVITILPDRFFLHCALMIILLVILGSIILYVVYHFLKKRSGIRYRKLPNIKV